MNQNKPIIAWEGGNGIINKLRAPELDLSLSPSSVSYDFGKLLNHSELQFSDLQSGSKNI